MKRHFTYDSKYFPPAPVVTIKLAAKETNLSTTDLTALIDTGADASFAPLSVLESIQAGIGKVHHARSLRGETQSFSSFIVDLQMNGATLPGMVVLGYDPFFYGHCISPDTRSTLFVMFLTRIPR